MPTPAHILAARLLRAVAREQPALVPEVAALAHKLRPCRHGPGFSSVLWYGQQYSFSAGQAAIVRQLWAAWENQTPAVRHETLLIEAGSEAERLADVFKGHPAWRTLIVAGAAKGTFRLADPATTPAAPAGDEE